MIPTKEQIDRIIAATKRLTPKPSKWSLYGNSTAGPLANAPNAPMVLDHLLGSDVLLSVKLRKPGKCARCDCELPRGDTAWRLLTFASPRHDRFCGFCVATMIKLGKMPGSDSLRRLAGDFT